MKVAFLSQHFYPEPFSNSEIAKWLISRGHEVDAVCCVPNYPEGKFYEGYSNTRMRDETWEGIRIHRAWTIARGKGHFTLFLNYLTYPVMASVKLASRVRRRADVSFVSLSSPIFQAFAGLFLKYVFKVPTVYWIQDIWPESLLYTLNIKTPLIVKPMMWITGWLCRGADLVLVQSEAFPPMIERFGVDPARIRVLPNTAPPTYRPMIAEPDGAAARMFAGVPEDSFRLVFAGNIGESQDLDTYIAAAKRLKDANCKVSWIMVGSGRDLARAQSEVAKFGLEDTMFFPGRVKEAEVPPILAHADALLVGLKDNPIFRLTAPYKVQCYMACGKPMVASLSGEGARIITKAGAGLVAQPETPGDLAGKVMEMVGKTPAERAEMGQNGRDFFETNYARDLVYANLETWLEEAASGEAPKQA